MSKEFEDKLLGSLILYPEAWELVADLELDDFRDVKNRKIFSVLKALRDKGDAGGDGYAIRIVNALKAKGDFEAIGGANEIARLANSVPNGAHAEFYRNIIKHDRSSRMTENEWLQINQAASGCIDGTSDDWPDLVSAIEHLTGQSFNGTKSADWLQGFCDGWLQGFCKGAFIRRD